MFVIEWVDSNNETHKEEFEKEAEATRFYLALTVDNWEVAKAELRRDEKRVGAYVRPNEFKFLVDVRVRAENAEKASYLLSTLLDGRMCDATVSRRVRYSMTYYPENEDGSSEDTST